MSTFWVPDGLAGQRIDSAAAKMTGLTRSRVADLIAENKVSLDGSPVDKTSHRLAGGELLEIDLSQPVRTAQLNPQIAAGLTIIFEDQDLIVVDKPAGVAAHPSLGWDGPDVLSHLAAAGVSISTSGAPERQGIVSRLDVGTSGAMVLAKSESAYSVLKRAFRERTVDKTYHAAVAGRPDPLSGTIDAPIGRHPGHEWKFAVLSTGREAVTHYETVEASRYAALLKIRLETGRTHQIRVHLAAIGHPCLGDPLYGANSELTNEIGLDRQWLHATELGFEHPTTGQYVHFVSQPARDLRSAWRKIREQR